MRNLRRVLAGLAVVLSALGSLYAYEVTDPLQKGDLVYSYSGTAVCTLVNFLSGSDPCHVGIFVGQSGVAEAVGDLSGDAVRYVGITDFESRGSFPEGFRGSRTTKIAPTPAQRDEIVAYLATQALGHTTYDWFHLRQKGGYDGLFCYKGNPACWNGWDGYNEFDCVGLAEHVYELAGLGLGLDPTPYPTDPALPRETIPRVLGFLTPEEQYISPNVTQPTVALSNGGSLTAAVKPGFWRYYSVTNLAANPGSLDVSVSESSGDVDLYLDYGSPPTLSDHVCVSGTGPGTERCSDSTPTSGTWIVGVYGKGSSFSVFSVAAAFTPPPPTVNWIQQPPSSISGGQQFTVSWTTTGVADRTEVRWSPTDPTAPNCCKGLGSSIDSSSGAVSSGQVTLVAPTQNTNGTPITSPTVARYVVRAQNTSTGDSGFSTVVPVTVNTPPSLLPVVSTGSASLVTSTSATVGGDVNANGSDTAIYFEYSTNSSLSNPTIRPTQLIGHNSFSVPVSDILASLFSGTTYYYRLVATNAGGTSQGQIRSFTTAGAIQAPAVITRAANNVTSTSAAVAGDVNANGSDTTIHFQYATNSGVSNPSTTPNQMVGHNSFSVPVSANLSGLTGDTTFYYRLVASNGGGTSAGAILSFRTAPSNPVIGMTVTPSSADLGTVFLGDTQSRAIAVTNPPSSTGILTGNIGDPGSPFTLISGSSGGQFSLSPGQSKVVAVTFAPQSDGPFTSVIPITHNANNGQTSPINVPLRGNGQTVTVGIQVSPSPLLFENVSQGDSLTGTITVTNPSSSNGNLSVTIEALSPPFYLITSSPFTIGPGTSFPVYVRFWPSAQGEFTTNLTITHNAAGSPAVVPIVGKTTITKLIVSPTSVDYGDVKIGQFVDQVITITNDSSSTGGITGDTIGSDFGAPSGGALGYYSLLSGTPFFSLAPGQTDTLVIRFSPPLSGSFPGALVVKHNSPGSPSTVPLIGRNTTSDPNLFTEIPAGLPAVNYAAVGWGDYDGDGDLDVAIAGLENATSMKIARVYRNDGGHVFTDIDAGLPGVTVGSLTWGDFDNDGDLDLILSGFDGLAFVTDIYRNDGGDTFTATNAGLTPVGNYSSAAWGDFDNDGDLDLLLSGTTNTSSSITKIYRNDGGGVFTDIGAPLSGVSRSSVAWGDFDNDGDQDILLTNATATRIYRNDGGGVFTDIAAALTAVSGGSAVWGDFDNDGNLDIAQCGYSSSGQLLEVYRNDGEGAFTKTSTSVQQVRQEKCTTAWGDYDNDGDLDILVTSYQNTMVYRNEGSGSFVDIGAHLQSSFRGTAAWGDYDGDGDLDVFVSNEVSAAKIYANHAQNADTAPTAPTGLSVTVLADSALLRWIDSSDAETSVDGLSYNLRLGTTPGGVERISPMSLINTGHRMLPALGSTGHRTGWLVTGLPLDTYYWSVQAIDAAFVGSEFSPEQSFRIAVCHDLDGDGFGAPGDPACPGGTQTDCDDHNSATHPGAPEVCDDADNNCNDQVDEVLGSTTCGIGVCQASVMNCVGGAPQTCTPGTPSLEVCDGLDNNCNGQVDDIVYTQVCGSCRTGMPGVCSDGTLACTGGHEVCHACGQSGQESCDNLDNDCDSEVDEDLGQTSCGVGECRRTVQSCVAGLPPPCIPGQPSAEICDGLDNNCDGSVPSDEADPDADGLMTCAGDNCATVHNPGQENSDGEADGGDACDMSVTSPLAGNGLCGGPPPTIQWSTENYDRFRVYVSWDQNFNGAKTYSSGDTWLRVPSWTPLGKKWNRGCIRANPSLYIRVCGKVAGTSTKECSDAVPLNVK